MQTFVVAIGGGSASGKSTLTQELIRHLSELMPGEPIARISMDSYLRRDDPTAPHFYFQHEAQTVFDFNHLESTDNQAILAAIQQSQARVLVLEGLMALAVPQLRDRADLRVFVQLEADVRAVRRMERDIRIGRGGGVPEFIAAYYIESARRGHESFVEPSCREADVIVRGDADFARVVPLLGHLVLGELKRQS